MTVHQRQWWKEGVVYQVYPASFKDTNDDGLGDLPGIISKLDYIRDLGTDILWVCPMYDSPQVDMGYDISNYEDVYPPFGTLHDMEVLIDEAHRRRIKIILDLVINHTSDQHQWFKESRSSKDNPKRDWYIWRPAKFDENGNRMPPNNWRGNFSQPAWTWDEHTQEYYLHLFCPEQPDLNFENPTARHAVYRSAIDFWLEKGVDGFRIDTVNMYSKGDLHDAPVTDHSRPDQPAGDIYCNGPRMHEFLREMHTRSFSRFDEVMTVGELPNTKDPAHVLRYVSYGDRQLSMVFNFDIVDLATGGLQGRPKFEMQPWHLSTFKSLWTTLQQFTTGTDGWATAFLENHDQGRSTTRFATDDPKWRSLGAKMLATFLATLTGTLFVYQGQELGAVNAPATMPLTDYKDVDCLNYINLKAPETSTSATALDYLTRSLHFLARDHARLPIAWDSAQPNAGFTGAGVEPWMRMNDDTAVCNVADQERDPRSVLNYWRGMLALRKQYLDLFTYGDFEALELDDESTFVFVKRRQALTGDGLAAVGMGHGEEKVNGDAPHAREALVALNFTGETQAWLRDGKQRFREARFLVGNYEGEAGVEEALRPWEARVFLL